MTIGISAADADGPMDTGEDDPMVTGADVCMDTGPENKHRPSVPALPQCRALAEEPIEVLLPQLKSSPTPTEGSHVPYAGFRRSKPRRPKKQIIPERNLLDTRINIIPMKPSLRLG